MEAASFRGGCGERPRGKAALGTGQGGGARTEVTLCRYQGPAVTPWKLDKSHQAILIHSSAD